MQLTFKALIQNFKDFDAAWFMNNKVIHVKKKGIEIAISVDL